MEALAQAGCFGADEFLEGSAAFMEKRNPVFPEIGNGDQEFCTRITDLFGIEHPIVCGGMM